MKPSYKFVRVVMGAVVGAALWAGCASDRRVVNEPAGAQSVQRQPVLDWQQNMSSWRVDTHPEWRTGWGMTFPNPPYCNPRIDDLGVTLDQAGGEAPESN
jgi:hypothetical protein